MVGVVSVALKAIKTSFIVSVWSTSLLSTKGQEEEEEEEGEEENGGGGQSS